MELTTRQKNILKDMETRKVDVFHRTDNAAKHYQEELTGGADYITGYDDGEEPAIITNEY